MRAAAILAAAAVLTGCGRPAGTDPAAEPPAQPAPAAPEAGATQNVLGHTPDAHTTVVKAGVAAARGVVLAAAEVPPGDLRAFVNDLKRTTPILLADFARDKTFLASGRSVERYTECTVYPGSARRVELTFPPTRLRDPVTGKVATYTRADMTRNTPAQTRYPEPFAWVRVELLP